MILKDCSPIDLPTLAKHKFGGKSQNKIKKAEEWLKELSQAEIQDNWLSTLTDKVIDPEPVVYTDPYGQWWTGRYIGALYFDGIDIEIQPRFGIEFVANNLPLNNFKAANIKGDWGSGEKFIHILQALMWVNKLIKAARHATPVVKSEHQQNAKTIRGRLDVRQTIRLHRSDKTKVVSVFQQKEVANPVSIAIILTFYKIKQWFPNHDITRWLPEAVLQRLQQMEVAVGRNAKTPSLKNIKRCRINSIAKGYLPLALFSLDILHNKGITEKASDQTSKTLLLDVAELWELYVLDILRTVTPDTEEVKHGTFESDAYLLESEHTGQVMGKLMPDFITESDGNPIKIADAKYKRLGDAPWHSPKRDDLYQMTAYLSRYIYCDSATLFYPEFSDELSSKSNANQATSGNPWKLNINQNINFITLPHIKQQALNKLHSET